MENERKMKWKDEGRKKKGGKKEENVKKRESRNVCLIIDVCVSWNPST